MIRILHIVGRMDRAGAETMIMNLYRVLDRTRFQFDFLYNSTEKCDYDEEIESLGGKIYRLSRIDGASVISRTKELIKILKDHPEIEIVHSHTLLSSAFNMWAAKKAGIKSRIAHAHSTNDLDHQNSLKGSMYRKASRYLIQKYATTKIACGKDAAKFLFPKEPDPVILPNAIDVESFNNIRESNPAYLRKELNFEENCLIISQIGRFNSVKNHNFTLGLCKYLKNIDANFLMVFAGSGELEKNVKSKSEQLGLSEHIKFLGIRADIAHIMAGSDVLLMPSLHEGFPVVLVESQAVGIPAVISGSIAQEVDLGVGLMSFVNLEHDFEQWWVEIQKMVNRKKLPAKPRLQKLKQQGFDIFSSVKSLEEIYSPI